MSAIDMERLQREAIRWRILVVLDISRPKAISESLIMQTIHEAALDATQLSLRQELDYLEKRGLIEIAGKDTGLWLAEINRHGVDIVEYTVPCEPGIKRPSRG